jgi:Family of unknown function (DUF6130)
MQKNKAITGGTMHWVKRNLCTVFLVGGLGCAALAQSPSMDCRGAVALVPLEREPPAKLVVDAPLAAELARGTVVIRYRTENLHIVPVFGAAALKVSPRIGHLHVWVDDLPWHWADTSNEPIILVGMPPGPHNVVIGLADPTHQVILRKRISFVVPGNR